VLQHPFQQFWGPTIGGSVKFSICCMHIIEIGKIWPLAAAAVALLSGEFKTHQKVVSVSQLAGYGSVTVPHFGTAPLPTVALMLSCFLTMTFLCFSESTRHK